MALNGGRTFVGFGFGAIQAGLFLHEAYRSGAFGRLVVAEVLPERVASIRQAGGFFSLNIAHADSIEAASVGPIEIYDPAVETDRKVLIDAAAEAEELGTAIPSVDYYRTTGSGSLHRVLAAGLEAKVRQLGPRAIIYAAENDNCAAQKLAQAVDEVLPAVKRSAVRQRVRFLNTVIGKMSGVAPADNGLLPVTPGDDIAFLVEAFNRILISRVDFHAPFQRGISVFEEKVQLVPFEEAKLYGHNAGHATAAYLAMAIGLERIADLCTVPSAMEIVRAAMVDEAGAALVQKHVGIDPLFTPTGMVAYADDLFVRMVNPNLQDTAARVGRDPARKLGWDDRLIGAMRLTLHQGLVPHRLAMGAAAAVRVLRQESGSGKTLTDLLRDLWGDVGVEAVERQQVLDLVESGEQALSEWLTSSTDIV